MKNAFATFIIDKCTFVKISLLQANGIIASTMPVSDSDGISKMCLAKVKKTVRDLE